ncbi:MAG: ATP-dependent DNA helicase RecQ [Verrucomicrobiota bacterium JB023]|nr:ATP-dependent DNA helicase RecQ [Verrucomicrobiota bacterium JB023]
MDDRQKLLLETRLKSVFGFESLRPGQAEVVNALMAGQSALALFPTGAGKSLCYQLPAILFEGLTLVVSPLLALMKDQVESLRAKGIAAERLDSTLDAAESAEVFRRLNQGQVKLLYVAPERFASERFRNTLQGCQLDLLAVDEAHCISEWGHNFRPDYLKLADFAREAGVARCLALTATATPDVAADICKAFAITEEGFVRTSFRRPNLALRVTPSEDEDRVAHLASRLREFPGATIVYVTLQFTAESVAAKLREAGVGARAYHAGMRAEARSEVQEDFMSGRLPVVVATIAFGMGIDKADVRAVYHYNLPKTLENYAQEVGRAGRDGEEAHCEVLACLDDRITLENFIYGDTPDSSAVKSLLEHILMLGDEIEISPYELSRGCDVKPVVIETLLAYLEMDGWVEARGSSFARMAIQFVRGEEQTLAGHTERRQQFLRTLFSHGQRGRVWLTFELQEVAEAMGEPVEKIRKTLGWLEGHGDITVKVSQFRKRYRLLRPIDRPVLRELVGEMRARFEQREERDLERLEEVLSFFGEPGCLVLRLLSYFGEEGHEPCGKCSSCLEKRTAEREIPGHVVRELSVADLEEVQGVIAMRHPALRSPRQVARFLCGLASPASTAARLKSHRAFGYLEGYSFQEVLIAVESFT